MNKYLNVLYIFIIVMWTISLTMQHKVFLRLYKAIDDMHAQLVRLEVFLLKGDLDAAFQSMPTKCFFCEAPLMGGATRHKEGCEIGKLIDRHFPKVH